MRDETFEQMHLTGRDYWWYQAKERLMELLLDELSPELTPGCGSRILDIGCGTGTMFGFLAERGVVIGLEPSARAAGYASSRGLAHMVRGDASRAPFASDSFQVISLFDSLEHMDDDRAALTHARRMITDDGTLLVTVPAFQWLHSWRETQLGHLRRYTVKSLRQRIIEAGFDVQFASYMYSGLFPLLVLKSIKDRFVPPPKTYKSDIVMLPEPWNGMLAAWFCGEAFICKKLGLPFGTSAVCIAKPRLKDDHDAVDSNQEIPEDKRP